MHSTELSLFLVDPRQLRKEQLELEIMNSKASCIRKLLELEVGPDRRNHEMTRDR